MQAIFWGVHGETICEFFRSYKERIVAKTSNHEFDEWIQKQKNHKMKQVMQIDC